MAEAGEPRVRRTQAERRDETERRLVEAAARLIAERGIVRTSMAQVGEAAGYSRGIVNHHFGSKAALVQAISDHVGKPFTEQVSVSSGSEQGLPTLHAVARAYLDRLTPSDPMGRANLILWTEAIAAEPSLRASKVAADAYFRAQVERLVDVGIADGTIRPEADARAFAISFVGLLRGVALELLLDPDLDPDRALGAVLTTIDASLAPPS